MSKKTLFILNPSAGKKAQQRWDLFKRALTLRGVEFDEAVSRKPGDPYRLALEAAGKYESMGAVGGDGTVYEVINAILDSGGKPPALSIVPLGTGNDSARSIGIHTEADALAALTSECRRVLDLLEIRCVADAKPIVRYAMNFVSVGITSDLLRHTTPRMKGLFGRRLAYTMGLLLALRTHSANQMKITCDDLTMTARCIFAGANNGETFGGGIRIAPGAQVDDGKFEVNLIQAVGWWEATRHLRRLHQGRHTDHPKVIYRTAQRLHIETEAPADVAADGDLIGVTPVRIQVRPQALIIQAPSRKQT